MKKIILASVVSLALWQVASAEVQYFHSDHLGSTSVATNEGGNLQQVAIYSPYGEVLKDLKAGGINPTSFLYTGQELDRSSDLSYYGARYYDAALSRFTAVDPVERNRPYSYVRNNPLLFIDPTGREGEKPSYTAISYMVDYVRNKLVESPMTMDGAQHGYINNVLVELDEMHRDALSKAASAEQAFLAHGINVRENPEGAAQWLIAQVESSGEALPKEKRMMTIQSVMATSDLLKNGSAENFRRLSIKMLATSPIPKQQRLVQGLNRWFKESGFGFKGAGKLVTGVSVACGLQCLAEGDVLGATLNFAGELPPPFGPTADYLSILYEVEGDPSYRSPYLVEDRCVRNACHMK